MTINIALRNERATQEEYQKQAGKIRSAYVIVAVIIGAYVGAIAACI